MASIVLVAGVAGFAAAATLGLASVGAAAVTAQRVAGGADAAALAAADVASGAVVAHGEPCEVAARVAAAMTTSVAACRVEGLIVTITATGTFAGIPVTAHARAGPAPGIEREG